MIDFERKFKKGQRYGQSVFPTTYFNRLSENSGVIRNCDLRKSTDESTDRVVREVPAQVDPSPRSFAIFSP